MLYKRSQKQGSHWWVRFESKGAYVRQSSGTDRKELAREFERQLREALYNEETLGIEVHTWDEACARWYREKAGKRSLARDKQAVKLLDCPGSTDLAEVFAVVSRTDAGLSKCGLRERATLRSILNACVTWGWLDRAPKVQMPRAEKHDPRWITREQFATLAGALPIHASRMARFAVSTGLRSANVSGLKWSMVDMGAKTARVDGRETKSAKAIAVPLQKEAIQVLKECEGLHPIYVFTDHAGRAPVGSIKTTWLKAVVRAGLPGFRFHDLRHTWAAWHVLAGTPPMILKELGGWASLAMVERYGHINPGHLADWADNSKVRNAKKRK